MRAFILLCIAVSCSLWACKNDGSSPSSGTAAQASAPAADLDGYVITDLPGTRLQRAVKTVNGLLFEDGTLLDGKKHGIWTEYFPQELRIKDTRSYMDGKLTGNWLKYNNLGRVEEFEQYLNDQLHGIKVRYSMGKPLEYAEYKLGKLHGNYRTYHKNGTIQQEASFADGKQDGYLRFYDEDGKKTVEYLYKNGEKVSGGIIGQ